MSQDTFTQNQIEVLNTLFIVHESFFGKIKYVMKVFLMSLKKQKNLLNNQTLQTCLI